LREADDLITMTTHARRRWHPGRRTGGKAQLVVQRLREQTTDLVVHDLRNPLHSIMGAVGMLQMILPPGLLQENRDLFTLVNNNCDRMQRLVDSLLDISRMESGETELNLEPANLAQLIQAAVSRVWRRCRRGIASSVFMPAHLPPVEIDVDMIDRVIINLLDNAIVHAGWRADQRGGRAARRSRGVSIADTGDGIRPSSGLTSSTFSRGTRIVRVRPALVWVTFCRLAVRRTAARSGWKMVRAAWAVSLSSRCRW
jgi:K+-sensing histidine kinase KdpD